MSAGRLDNFTDAELLALDRGLEDADWSETVEELSDEIGTELDRRGFPGTDDLQEDGNCG